MSDVAEWANAVASAVLAVAAIYQLPLVAKQVKALADELQQARKMEATSARRAQEQLTLEACQRYDSDPVLDAASIRIWHASDRGRDYKNPAVDPRDMIVILNYLDGLAIGIDQKLYLEGIIKDHTQAILIKHVSDYIDSGIVGRQGYEILLKLRSSWTTNTSYSADHG